MKINNLLIQTSLARRLNAARLTIKARAIRQIIPCLLATAVGSVSAIALADDIDIFNSNGAAASKPNLLLLFDMSGSMELDLDGVLLQPVESLPEQTFSKKP